MKTLLRFLGSLPFAIFLILSSACFVLAGTVLESKTESHLYAAYFTYSNPIFIALLWGFFVNILLSALNRWPFKKKHIPFLITHLGLIMILSGVLIKNHFGIQGAMQIMEGSGSDEIIVSNTQALLIEQKHPKAKTLIPMPQNSATFQKLGLQVLDYTPHCIETMETWTPGKQVRSFGYPYVIEKAMDVKARAQQAYIQASKIIVTDSLTHAVLLQAPLSSVLEKNTSFSAGSLKGDLEFSTPAVTFDIALLNQEKLEKIQIALDMDSTLSNQNLSSPSFGSLPFAIDIQCMPTLLFLQDDQDDVYFYAFDSYGRIHIESFKKDAPSPLMEYDEGFGGYTVMAKVPFSSLPSSRKDIEEQQVQTLNQELNENLAKDPALSPPLLFLKDGCTKAGVNFATTCLSYLKEWSNTHSWLYPHKKPLSSQVVQALEKLDWNAIPIGIKMGCKISSQLFDKLEEPLKNSSDILKVLNQVKWPLMDSIKDLGNQDLILTHILQQLFSASHLLTDYPMGEISNARLLSAYLRLYGIHWSSIELPSYSHKDEGIALECPVSAKHTPAAPSHKLEENRPMIALQLTQKGQTELLSLAYDRYAMGLKWPAMQGEYRLRFQPMMIKLPYRLRLRQARQINYANSSQPYSFESDLIITHSASGQQVEKTISMNNVYETWDGYRFYLANITPSDQGAVKRVQIVVNHDPAKYWLTYPGCFLLGLGIVLLFWIKPYGTTRF